MYGFILVDSLGAVNCGIGAKGDRALQLDINFMARVSSKTDSIRLPLKIIDGVRIELGRYFSIAVNYCPYSSFGIEF